MKPRFLLHRTSPHLAARPWALGAVLAPLLFVGVAPAVLGQDTITTLNSGTRTLDTPYEHLGVLYVATTGTATLEVVDGTEGFVLDGYFGYEVGGVGTATVSGGTLGIRGGLNIGHDGTGTLNVTGGSVFNRYGGSRPSYLGYNATGVGTATVSSGTWTLTQSMSATAAAARST